MKNEFENLFEPTTRTSRRGGGKHIDPEAIKRLVKMASEALNNRPENTNSVATGTR